MKTKIEEIREGALSLSSTEKASLIHDLILSLDDNSSFNFDPEYEAEIQRRLESVKNGEAKGQPAESVFAEIKNKYR